MIKLILKLYTGNASWYTLYPNNVKKEVRHSLDFMYFSKYLAEDMPENIKTSMVKFVDEEILTDHWMRTQSLKDSAAQYSDRPDHGPMGAYDGWPAEIMDGLVELGHPQKAWDFYHAIEPVTHEGVWTQSHELWGENKTNKKAKVRIAARGGHNRESSAGIQMAQVMIKNFFGFHPEMTGDPIKIMAPDLKFKGQLHHVLYGSEFYKLSYKNGSVKMDKEKVK